MGPQLKEVGNHVYKQNSYHLRCNIYRLLLELKGYGELLNKNHGKAKHQLKINSLQLEYTGNGKLGQT